MFENMFLDSKLKNLISNKLTPISEINTFLKKYPEKNKYDVLIELAISNDNLNYLKYLSKNSNFDANTFITGNSYSAYPIQIAIINSAVNTLEFLLLKGASLDTSNDEDEDDENNNESYLEFVIRQFNYNPVENIQIIKLLIQYGAIITDESMDKAKKNKKNPELYKLLIDTKKEAEKKVLRDSIIELPEDLVGSRPLFQERLTKYEKIIKPVYNNKKPVRVNIPTKWHDICNEKIDIISQADWEDDDVKLLDIIFIKNGKNIECFDADSIRKLLVQPTAIAMDWIKNPMAGVVSATDAAQGYGYIPDPSSDTFYLKVYLLNYYVTVDSIIHMLKSKNRYFEVNKINKKRIGNIFGVFGVGNQHAQLPLEQTVELVESPVSFHDTTGGKKRTKKGKTSKKK